MSIHPWKEVAHRLTRVEAKVEGRGVDLRVTGDLEDALPPNALVPRALCDAFFGTPAELTDRTHVVCLEPKQTTAYRRSK